MREDCVESSKQLRSLRETHKMTQSDMAAAAECSLRNYQNYEYGKAGIYYFEPYYPQPSSRPARVVRK